MLARKLRSAGANVILTRNMDTFISLNKRVSISHQYDADAFIKYIMMLLLIHRFQGLQLIIRTLIKENLLLP